MTELFPHQQAAIAFINSCFDDGVGSVRYRAPTGTFAAATIASFVAEKAREGKRCLQVFGARQTLAQGQRTLKAIAPDVSIGGLDTDAPIIVCTYVEAMVSLRQDGVLQGMGFDWIVFHEGWSEQRKYAQAIRAALPDAKLVEECLMPQPHGGMIETDAEVSLDGVIGAYAAKAP